MNLEEAVVATAKRAARRELQQETDHEVKEQIRAALAGKAPGDAANILHMMEIEYLCLKKTGWKSFEERDGTP